jgi:hypothetical protein
MSTNRRLTVGVAAIMLIPGAAGSGAAAPDPAQPVDSTDNSDAAPGPEGRLPGPVSDSVDDVLDSTGSVLDGDSDQPESTPSDRLGSGGSPEVAQSGN